jgi:hypothetical protein
MHIIDSKDFVERIITAKCVLIADHLIDIDLLIGYRGPLCDLKVNVKNVKVDFLLYGFIPAFERTLPGDEIADLKRALVMYRNFLRANLGYSETQLAERDSCLYNATCFTRFCF